MKSFYKIILLLYGCYFSLATSGQNLNLVSPITISMPNNPVANTDDWGKGTQSFIITAKKNTSNELQSWMLVTIKSGGSKICGSNTPQTATEVYFDIPLKTWTGTNAASLLGNPCTLKPGEYELCVQFYLKDRRTVIGENCKSFTINETKTETYSPPQNIMPVDGKELTKEETSQPTLFRWTPIIPKPKEDIIYKVIVFEIKKGQTTMQAMKTNGTLFEQDVQNQTQLSCCINPIVVWPIAADSKYGWYVKSHNKQETNYGNSEPTGFSVKTTDPNPEKFNPPINQMPVDGKIFNKEESKQPIVLRWTPVVPKPKADVTYKVKVVEILKGQTSEQAIKANKPIDVLEVKNQTQTTYKLAQRPNLGYAWNVEASKKTAMGDIEMLGTSEATGFMMSSAGCGTNSDNVKVSCKGWVNGVPTYTISVTFNNIIPTSGGQQCTTVMNTITSSTGTISSLATLPVTIPIGGTSPTVTFTYTPTVPGATIAAFSYQGIWNDGSSNTSNFSNTNVSLPSCVCDFCQKAVEFDHDLGTATISGNSLNIVQPLWDMAGNTIFSVKAEIISFERYVGDECMSCNKDAALWGNFTSGTLGALAGTFGLATSPVSGNTHHTLYWNPPTGYTGALNLFKLNINTPPLSNLACCCEKIKTKIRYTYTFKDKATGECKTCNGGVFEYEAQKGTCPANPTSTNGGVKQN